MTNVQKKPAVKHPSLLDCLINPTVFGEWFHSQTTADRAEAQAQQQGAAKPAPPKSDQPQS